MKIGILACGPMAETFARTLIQMEEAECYAVASRSLSRAEAFAREYGFTKAYGSYEALCEDPEVELVYIATPHSCHYENMELCIRHKKPVLCEKAFTMNAGEARKILELAEQAMKAAGIAAPTHSPIRGGTDGSVLTYMGLPCPNLPSAGHNAHGRFEYAPVVPEDRGEDHQGAALSGAGRVRDLEEERLMIHVSGTYQKSAGLHGGDGAGPDAGV